ncbi:MAG: HDOD domain-containing protein [Methylohalobius sp.]|nr:HDOD domain-containing protein [Methylohalobius sp.]
MTDFLIGRQPIFDRNLDVFGYELLFRSLNTGPQANGTVITQQLIVDAILELGLEKLTGRARAFINFTADNVLTGAAALLPSDRVVVEILEDAKVTADLICAVRRLADQGYRIALDDFVFDPRWEPMLQIAHIVKLDVRAQEESQLKRAIDRLKAYGVQILLEKIETEAEFQLYHSQGGDYFQGYFLSSPQMVAGRRLGASQQAILQILSVLHTTADLHQVAELIRRDVALSYKLLNFINSAYFALPEHIDSIEQTVILLGLESIKRWVSLLMLSTEGQKRPKELIQISLIRARMCEQLASASNKADPNQAFLVGLFSNLDALLAMPLPEVLKTLPLAPEVQAGLHQQGPLGEILCCALNYERWQLARTCCAGLPLSAIGRIYLDSLAWAQQIYASLY